MLILFIAGLSPEERRTLGMGHNFVRVSVGLEEVPDLIADLSNALDAVAKSQQQS